MPTRRIAGDAAALGRYMQRSDEKIDFKKWAAVLLSPKAVKLRQFQMELHGHGTVDCCRRAPSFNIELSAVAQQIARSRHLP
jgi:hypothetical protein